MKLEVIWMIIKRKWNEVTLQNNAFGKLWKSYKNNLMKNGKRLSAWLIYILNKFYKLFSKEIYLKFVPV